MTDGAGRQVAVAVHVCWLADCMLMAAVPLWLSARGGCPVDHQAAHTPVAPAAW